MSTVTGFSSARMLSIENSTVTNGFIDLNGHLILSRRDGTPIDAGQVKGAKGDKGDMGDSLLPAGIILAWPSSTIPTNWLECNGQAVSRVTYSDLFAIIGVTYGSGNGTTTFNLPDLRGKVVVGHDASQTEFSELNQTGGSKFHTHTEGDLRAAIGASANDANSLSYQASPVSPRGPGTSAGYTIYGNGSWSGDSKYYNHYTNVYGTTETASSLPPYRVEKYIIKSAGGIGVVSSTVETALLERVATLENMLRRGPRRVIPSSVAVGSGTASVDSDGLINFSGCTSVSLNGIFDGLGGDAYEIHGIAVGAADIGGSLFMRLRSSGVDNTTGYFQILQYGIANSWSGATFSGEAGLNKSAWTVGYRQTSSFDLVVKRPGIAGFNKEINGLIGSDSGPNQVAGPMYGRTSVSPSRDGITLFPASSNITGWLKVVKIA